MLKTLPICSANAFRWKYAGARLLMVVLAVACASIDSVDAKEGSWFQPFSWQESPTGNPIDSPPPGMIRQAWNPLKWSNQPQTKQPAQAEKTKSKQQSPTALGPQGQASVRATDSVAEQALSGLVQPHSVGGSNATAGSTEGLAIATDQQTQQAAYQQPAIEWPAEKQAKQKQDGQGTNPFGWTNSGPTVRQTVRPTSEFPLLEQGRQPWNWSNEPLGQQKPRELMPPEEPSFNSAVLDALKWSDHPGDSVDPAQERVARGLPPKGASEAEMIAWEKEHLPWTRPFYWSNDDGELGPHQEIIAPDATPSPNNVPMLARPFTWENRQASNQANPLPQSYPNSYPTTQAAAFFQAGEALPPPNDPVSKVLQGEPLEGEAKEDSEGAGIDEEKKGGLAEAESLGEAPVDNSLQFLRADTVLLDPGEFQFEYGFNYSKFDLSLPVAVTTPSGSVVELADFHLRQLSVPLEIRYGLARRVQMFVNVPFGWANTEFSIPGFEDFENDGGIGDVIFGGSFLLRDNDPCNKPDAILTLSSVAPTGNQPFTPAGLSPSSPSLGNGVWSLAANLLFIQNYDPVVVFYGFGTRQSFEGELDGRDFQPGGEYNYQFGVGFAVNRQITFSTRFNGAYVSDTDLDGVRVPGTTQEPMILSLAMTVSKNKKLIEPFVDFGLTDDSTDARFGITWTR